MPNSFRRDEITERYGHATRTDSAQSDALARMRAEAAARAVLDKEQAARDIQARWAGEQVAASRPAPQVGAAAAARDAMITRAVPRYAPPVEVPAGHAPRYMRPQARRPVAAPPRPVAR